MKTIEGWIIQYGKLSRPITLPNNIVVREQFAPAALADSVTAINAGAMQAEANIEHDDNALCRIGVTGDGKNVRIENREEGVYAYVDILPDTVSQDVYTKINAGVISDFSIEFKAPEGYEPTYAAQADGSYVRTFTRAILTGFAVTTAGLYPDAKIVAAKETPDATRSIRKADVEVIERELAEIQRLHAATLYHRYNAFNLGIR
jgi:phage head maturation protease